MREYYLTSAFGTLTFDSRPPYWPAIVVAWIATSGVIFAATLGLIVFVLPELLGFKTAVLLLLATMAMPDAERRDP